MRTVEQIRNEIEVLRKELNEKVCLNKTRVPSSEVMSISREIDELLNELNGIVMVKS